MKIKVLVVFGTRPEAIKMAPLCHALINDDFFDVKICVTAQHREMLDQVLNIFSIKPNIDLNLMRSGQDLTDITASVLISLRDVFDNNKPDLVLVHGDTTTSFATSISAFYNNIAVAHVEAGLRTNDIWSPYPEELNRQIVSKIAAIHFAPTNQSKINLIKDNISEEKIFVTGNTVIDSLFWMLNKIENNSESDYLISKKLTSVLNFDFKVEKYILVTGHRRENFGQGFIEICNALANLAAKYPNIHFVYPVHMNPNVQDPVNKELKGLLNIHLIKPLDYDVFVYLLKFCHLVLTDSGGIQEEAPSLGKPVLVMRDLTERPEAIDAETVKLVGANKSMIFDGVCNLLDNDEIYTKMSLAHNPYGDGRACERIISAIKKVFHEKL